ncbi:MAG: glycoside hydrolase family 31 protein [Bacteroidales bacterium]|jgi:alpha-glucosidase|nr:glycoside hydrolase family 31 protein [Bacteroidales bacterium]
MRTIFSFAVSIILTISIMDSSAQNMRLGNFQKMTQKGKRIQIQSSSGIVEIQFYSENIIRIHIDQQKLQPDFSYSVNVQPSNPDIQKTESAKELILKTSAVTLKIIKTPLSFSFYTPDGKLINADDPAFGTSWNNSEVTTYKTLQDGEKFIGLGEKTGNLDRRGSSFINWNTDNPHYENHTDPIYSSIPFYIGLHHQLAYGIFFDNTYKSYFNFGASQERFSSFGADAGAMDYYFIYDKNVEKIIEHYTWLTGRTPLPPVWALGYQQCRWSYYPDTEVLNIAETFRAKKIPADVIYLDIHYMDNYKVFTWHPSFFPKPEELLNKLKDLGFNTTVIIDPGIKIEKGYAAYEDGLKKDVFIKYPDGTLYKGQVWPGWCHFTDYTKPSARQWWGEQFSSLAKLGVHGFWNDMNEIATWGQATPSLVEFDWDGQKSTYRQAKNMYGMQMARATFEGAKKALNGDRPLIITRAGFAGLQRYTSIWTGDNQAHDDHMLLGVRLVNSLGMSGVAFSGYDVGGFGGNASPELFARWISLGTFSPFFRTHSAFNTLPSEPWSYGDNTENIVRNYINFRYKMLPYMYSNMFAATQSGIPVQRSLAIDYSWDPRVFYYQFQNQYLFGPSFLVIPAKSNDKIVKAYLPEGNWYHLYSGKKMEGNQEILIESPLERLPVFVKEGSILPLQKVIQHTGIDPGDTLNIHVFFSLDKNSFTYYEDDGITYKFEKKEYYKRNIALDFSARTLSFSEVEGTFQSKFKYIRIVLHDFPAPIGFVKSTIGIFDDQQDWEHNCYETTKALSNDAFIISLNEGRLD